MTPQRGRGRRRDRDDLAPVWKALASPVRRTILDLLHEGPRMTSDLADHFPSLTRFAVMQHLGVLERAELVTVQRDGRKRFNYLNPVPIQRIHDRWVARYARPWAEALVGLQDELESETPSQNTSHRKRG